MEVQFKLEPQTPFTRYGTGSGTRPLVPTNVFTYDKVRTTQKYRQVPIYAGVQGMRPNYKLYRLRVAQVTFYRDEMDPEFRLQAMDNVVLMCEVKWEELYAK